MICPRCGVDHFEAPDELKRLQCKIKAAREAIRVFGDETAPATLWARPRDVVEPFLAELLRILA